MNDEVAVVVEETAQCAVVPATDDVRANEVREKITSIKDNLQGDFLDLCDLLSEAHEGAYHLTWGYGNFAVWVEENSGLDISARQAFYYIAVSRVSKKLGIDKKTLKSAGMAKLKEIFSLDAAVFEKEILQLTQSAAEGTQLEDIKAQVKALKAPAGSPSEKPCFTIKLASTMRDTFDQAVELARQNYGDTVDPVTGDPKDISVSTALELICVNYLQDPNNQPEAAEDNSEDSSSE